MGHGVKENVADLFDDGVGLLSLVQRVPQACVHSYDIVYVPKYLFKEIQTTLFGYNVRLFQWGYPCLLFERKKGI